MRRTGLNEYYFPAPYPRYGRNLLRNGDGVINQRGTVTSAAPVSGANDDDAYVTDGWILLSEVNDSCDVSKETSTIPTGSRSAIALDVETADIKHGIFQVIESANSLPLVNTDGSSHVSLSFKLQSAVTIASWGAAVLAWDGTTPDSVTSDCVSVWNGTTASPTFAANWTLESPAAKAADIGSLTTASFTEYKIEGIPIDTASTKNIGVFIYANDTSSVTIGQISYITDIMLNEGSIALPFEHRSIEDELRLCQRHFWSSYNLGTAPGTASDVGRIEIDAARTVDHAANGAVKVVPFPVAMRTTPTGAIYSTSTGTAAKVFEFGGAGDLAAQVINPGTSRMTVQVTQNPGANPLSFHATASAEL